VGVIAGEWSARSELSAIAVVAWLSGDVLNFL
jgi:hypothetical protein